ncbi:MAG: UbiX family flavin prenyltransferase [Magnetococcales bacterium]|nr:UbiX family flavin prenyltransferase [Magnetococcales bacterium]
MNHPVPAVVVAMTGASGACYGLHLIRTLLDSGYAIDLLLTPASQLILAREQDLHWCGNSHDINQMVQEHFQEWQRLRYFGPDDWHASCASGSGHSRQMVVCPCSMGTLAAIAHGLSNNLLERAADVMLKERRQLILVPRETPLSALHLQNMLRLSRLGAIILPATPGFYHRPGQISQLIDFVVARILDQMGIEHQLVARYGAEGTVDHVAYRENRDSGASR